MSIMDIPLFYILKTYYLVYFSFLHYNTNQIS